MTTRSAVSLTVTSKGQVTLRKELLAHLGIQPGQRVDVEVLPGGRLELHAEEATGSIHGFIGILAGRSTRRASLQELNEAVASGWAGLPTTNLPSTNP
jgi:AbrB family looped-hinge helix DNA binding protein